MPTSWDRVPIDAQSIEAPLSQAAIFLVLCVTKGDEALAKVREVLGDIDDLVKTVGFRDLTARLSCIAGLGSELWDRLGATGKPRELKPFTAIKGKPHRAPATPGDLLFHIRAERVDICFEFERILLQTLGDAVSTADEVFGFRYFDARDLLGFVDGTAIPQDTKSGKPPSSAAKIRNSRAEAMSSCRSTSTIWQLGVAPQPRCRKKSSAAPRSTTSN
jgi:putative iron-dependent peroxidase